jgi:hypothetical protein
MDWNSILSQVVGAVVAGLVGYVFYRIGSRELSQRTAELAALCQRQEFLNSVLIAALEKSHLIEAVGRDPGTGRVTGPPADVRQAPAAGLVPAPPP